MLTGRVLKLLVSGLSNPANDYDYDGDGDEGAFEENNDPAFWSPRRAAVQVAINAIDELNRSAIAMATTLNPTANRFNFDDDDHVVSTTSSHLTMVAGDDDDNNNNNNSIINTHIYRYSGIATSYNNDNNSMYQNNTMTGINGTTAIDDGGNDILKTAEVIGSLLSFYYVPILVCTGSIGNILSVIVFFKTKLRKLSSSYYLAALAISDTCFLLGLFAQWLNFVDVNVYNRDYFCQFFTFFSSLACFCSDWFVVAFTVERFIAVMYPLKRQTMCTVRRAKIVLAGLTTLGCIHCAPFWISSQPVYSAKLETTICDINAEYKEYITILNYWDTIVVFAVPFTTIAILNTFTGCTVWKFATVRRTLTMQKRTTLTKSTFGSSSSCMSTYRATNLKRQSSKCSHPSGQNYISRQSSELRKQSGRRKLSNSSQMKVTKMLLVVSTVFVCLNLPSCVMRMKTFLETNTSANEKTTIVLQYIFQLLFITNFGINFVLYCVSGQNFRKAVLSMFQRVSSSSAREGTTQVTVSEYCRNSAGTGASTRRRLMSQHCWNEAHELQSIK